MRRNILLLIGFLMILVVGIIVVNTLLLTSRSYYLFGTFTRNVSQSQIDELQMELNTTFSVTAAIMESFPAHFQMFIRGLDACESVRQFLQTKSYIDSIGGCVTPGEG